MRIIGLDLALTSAHRAVVMEASGKFVGRVRSLRTDPEQLGGLLSQARQGLAASEPLVVVMEPTGLAWLPVAVYLLLQQVQVYLVNSRQVSDLRRYFRRHHKSDRIDARVLAQLYLLSQAKLHPLCLPPAAVYHLQRVCKLLAETVQQITRLQNKIQAVDRAAWLGGWEAEVFKAPFSPAAGWCREQLYNPYTVLHLGQAGIEKLWSRSELADAHGSPAWIPALLHLAHKVVAIYGPQPTYVDFEAFQQEMQYRQKWLRQFESDRDELRREVLLPLYHQLHPSGNLETLQGVGAESAAAFLSFIGQPQRFASASQCRSWSGMIPRSDQSSDREAKGLHITQAGPGLIKKYLYLDAEVARRYDPQLAKIYYDQMVHHGKHHSQAVCAVATHLLDRILVVLKAERPYELRDVDGTPLDKAQARQVVADRYTVPEAVRQRNRRQKRRQQHDQQAERKLKQRESSPDWVRG